MMSSTMGFLIVAVLGTIALGAPQFMGGSYKWNNPGSQLPDGCTHGTYHSDLMNVDVGYNICLPPEYDKSDERYPVIYSLHGMSGNENSNCQTFASILRDGISAHTFPSVIMVFVNGRGNTFYSDSKDGTVNGESTIVDELIPHIDATYRTKADRTQRAIEGISMGGFGALMLGFKHPDMFASIGSYDAALVNWDTLSEQQFDRSIPNSIFGNDEDYFNENSYPFTFATKNVKTINSLGIKVRMITGDNDVQMGPLHAYNCAMRDTLNTLGIELDFTIIPGGTHGAGMNQTTGKENIIFHTSNFNSATTRTASTAIWTPSPYGITTRPYLFSMLSHMHQPQHWRYPLNVVTLYSVNGKKIRRIPAEDPERIDGRTSGKRFAPGLYIMKIHHTCPR